MVKKGRKELSETQKCFMAGMKALRDAGWLRDVYDKDLADAVGVTPIHLSEVFRGHRAPGGKTQERLAELYGFRLEDVLRMGRAIREGFGFMPFIGKIEALPAHSEEQAQAIVELTNKRFGLAGHLMGYRPRALPDFLDGKITAAEFYKDYESEIQAIVTILRGVSIEA